MQSPDGTFACVGGGGLSGASVPDGHGVETNPGPTQTRRPKFPCGICDKACTWNPRKPCIACDDCSTWFHKACLNMPSAVFNTINPDTSWICYQCGMPNLASSLFEHPTIETSNSFSVLSQLADDSNSTCSTIMSPTSDIGAPTHASTPTPKPKPRRKESLRVMVANIQSVNAKKHTLALNIESLKPDIIIGCETWLTPSIASAEFLPDGYLKTPPVRKDRHDGYGGVMIAVKDDLIIEDLDIQTTCELVVVKIQLAAS